MEDMDMLLKSMEEMNEEQLREVVLHAEELIAEMKKPAKEGYEDDFIDVMLNCGLDMLNARINLIDFKSVAAAYLQGKGSVYLEDLEYAMEVVFRKNGYTPTYESKQMINEFIQKTFGQNIPSMAGSLII